MDKKIWLGVIREELVLLDKLATGMIEDDQLTEEEVNLAISRSMMVAREFEMLLHEIHVPENVQEETEAIESVQESSEPAEIPSSTIPFVDIPEEISLLLEEAVELKILKDPITSIEPTIPSERIQAEMVEEIEAIVKKQEELPTKIEMEIAAMQEIPDDEPVPELPVPTEEKEPTADLLDVEVMELIPQSPSPSVSPSPLPPVSPSSHPGTEEHSAIDNELKKEEHPLFKLTPIKSMSEGMTLNDRYLFQKELFGNNKSRLDETIADMDRLANIQEAIAYLKAHFKWMKGEASEKFVLLVKRRFYEPKG